MHKYHIPITCMPSYSHVIIVISKHISLKTQTDKAKSEVLRSKGGNISQNVYNISPPCPVEIVK